MIRVRFRGTRFLIEHPIAVESELFGPMLSGLYRMEGDARECFGSFPLHDIDLVEPVAGQLSLSTQQEAA